MCDSDKEQIEFIECQDNVILKAPPGYGKTGSIIKKIEYEYKRKRLNNRKILAITFSVNSATDIKDKVEKKIDNNIDVGNYHSIAMKIIREKGYTIHKNLKNIDSFQILSEKECRDFLYENSKSCKDMLNLSILSKFKNDSNFSMEDRARVESFESACNTYYNFMIKYLIEYNIITYDGMLLLAFEILNEKQIKDFYNERYPLLIIDEFQDTNFLHLRFIEQMIGENTRIVIVGDPNQRIYSFLGAINNIFEYMKTKYSMIEIELTHNYRFINPDLNNLEKRLRDIRSNIKTCKKSDFEIFSKIKLNTSETLDSETNLMLKDLEKIDINKNSSAVLVGSKKYSENVLRVFKLNDINYFYGLYGETDYDYIKFHDDALINFKNKSGNLKYVSNKVFEDVVLEMDKNKDEYDEDIYKSLKELLELFFKESFNKPYDKDIRYNFILETLENKTLKRYINRVENKIVLLTIHGAKGLEWDYVFVPSLVNGHLPSYLSLCKGCQKNIINNSCIPIRVDNDKLIEQINLFYVCLTRAKRDLFLYTNTGKNNDGYKNYKSCLLSILKLS